MRWRPKWAAFDIALNSVGILHVQGTPFVELSFQDYADPIRAYIRTHFLTAKAVARHMVKQGSGVILTQPFGMYHDISRYTGHPRARTILARFNAAPVDAGDE